jgi:nucleotide-binding universal stress UspA family protein
MLGWFSCERSNHSASLARTQPWARPKPRRTSTRPIGHAWPSRPGSEAVLASVQKLAARLGAELILLQVVDWPPPAVYPEGGAWVVDVPETVAAARRYVSEVADRLRPTLHSVQAYAEPGRVLSWIAQIASREHADVIAMATHGRGGLARVVLGSTATDVVQRLNLPLFLVRPTAQHAQVTSTPPAHAAIG